MLRANPAAGVTEARYEIADRWAALTQSFDEAGQISGGAIVGPPVLRQLYCDPPKLSAVICSARLRTGSKGFPVGHLRVDSLVQVSGSSSTYEVLIREEVLRIGAVNPLTGPFASYGEPVRDGMLLAVDEINATDGIRARTNRA